MRHVAYPKDRFSREMAHIKLLHLLFLYFLLFLQNDFFYMEPAFEFPGHQLPGGSAKLSPHHKWLATYGTDGKVMLRTIGQMVSALPCVILIFIIADKLLLKSIFATNSFGSSILLLPWQEI